MAKLDWKRPFEMQYKSKPSLEDRGGVGCLWYAMKTGESNKFKARAKKCVLLGCTFGFKGYKLYDLTLSKVFHSRDIIFQENILV